MDGLEGGEGPAETPPQVRFGRRGSAGLCAVQARALAQSTPTQALRLQVWEVVRTRGGVDIYTWECVPHMAAAYALQHGYGAEELVQHDASGLEAVPVGAGGFAQVVAGERCGPPGARCRGWPYACAA